MIVWAAILGFLVAAFVFLVWDVRTRFRKNARLIARFADQAARFEEDQAWAAHLAAARIVEETLTEVLTGQAAQERLNALAEAPVLEGVA